jgi:hypothetical protein
MNITASFGRISASFTAGSRIILDSWGETRTSDAVGYVNSP